MFRNLRIYRVSQLAAASAEELADQLEPARLRPCGRLEPQTSGWISPYGGDRSELVHTVGRSHMLRYGLEEKVLPSAVVKAALSERVRDAQQRTGLAPGRREVLRLKDEVLMDLLPRAFVNPRGVNACLDLETGWLAVDSASARRADELATSLRMSLQGLELSAPDLRNRIRTHLTRWLQSGRCPEELQLGDECDLRDERDSGATIRCRRQDLTAGEIRQHLGAGMQVVRLGLRWGERLDFTISEEFAVGKLKPGSYFSSQMEDLSPASEIEQLDVEFALASLEYRSLIERLVGWLEWED